MFTIVNKYIEEICHSLERTAIEKLNFLRGIYGESHLFQEINEEMPNHSCSICQGFLVDWFSCPPSHTNPFRGYLRHKSVLRIAPSLAKEVIRIINSFTPFQEIILLRQMAANNKYIEETTCTSLFTEEMWDILHGMSRLLSVSQVGVKEDVDVLLGMIQDAGVFGREHQDNNFKWIGYSLQKVWEPLQRLHAEHSGLAPVSGCGAAPGLESHGAEPKSTVVPILWENYF